MKREVNTKFYNYRQNNSGGRYTQNDTLTVLVVIEAISADHADSIAEDIGIYFNGVANEMDCECCGDRWSPCYDDSGTEEPMDYDKPLVEGYVPSFYLGSPDKPYAYIYYMDGTKITITGLPKEEVPELEVTRSIKV